MSVTLARAEPSIAGAGDYIELMKPRVMSLVVFTALVGMLVAPGHIHPVIGFAALLCIAVGAGAAGALNMWYDADIDALMARTASRPIPRGRVTPGEAAGFGFTLAAFSVVALGLLVNLLAAALLAFTIFFYVAIYTMWLKRSTPQNIVIGGAAGALPPMIGWAAATGSLALEPIVLFLIIFFWTPPHFWALSLYRIERLRPCRRAHAAGRRRRHARRAARSCFIPCCWRPLGSRRGCSAIPDRSTASPRLCWAPACWCWRCGCAGSRAATRRASNCLLSRSSICFCCSPCC